MSQQPEKNLFVLRVFCYVYGSKKSYSIDKNDFLYSSNVKPGFYVMENDVGYYQSLAEAEKQIRKISKQKDDDIYGFFVTELPLGSLMKSCDYISCYRYLEDGSLWLKSEGPSDLPRQLRVCNKEYFNGRDPKTIRFKEGDIVEIPQDDYVKLAIIWKTPSTTEQVENYRDQLRNHNVQAKKLLNELSMGDSYNIVSYSVSEDGSVSYCVSNEPSVNVLPPSKPVPRKIAAELRKQLKRAKEEEFDLPF